MRTVSLTTVKGGMNLLRRKGGAASDSLLDLHNGYVSAARTAVSRPGTAADVQLPAGTHGLVAFNGGFVVFSNSAKTIADPRYRCEVILHPEDPILDIERVHFAAPFLGFLYVVIEWANGDVFHYWLQTSGTWAADKVFREGEVIQPTSPNGLTYVAERLGGPAETWTPHKLRAVGNKIEPTKPNGYEYTAVEVYGDNPASGSVEPAWPATDGAVVYEDTDGAIPPPAGGGSGGGIAPPPDVGDRYGNNDITNTQLR